MTEDQQAYEDHDLLKWAREAPEQKGWDDPPDTEDQAAFRKHDRDEWLKRKPRVSNPYSD